MTGYDIFLSNGDLLTTINVKTIDLQTHSSLVLIGQGIPNYGAEIAQNFVWMLENFSDDTPPVNPLLGQIWHDRSNNRETFFNGTGWLPLLSSGDSFSNLFDMLPSATNIDFTIAGTTQIFTASGFNTYYPMMLLLIPNGAVGATTGPIFNMYVTTPGDLLPTTVIDVASTTTFSPYLTSIIKNAGNSGFAHTVAAGDGLTVDFFTQNLSQTDGTIVSVSIDGILQTPGVDYTILSLVDHQSYIRFTTAPSMSSTVLIVESPVSQTPPIISGTQSIYLQVTSAATGGSLNYNVFVFGFTQ